MLLFQHDIFQDASRSFNIAGFLFVHLLDLFIPFGVTEKVHIGAKAGHYVSICGFYTLLKDTSEGFHATRTPSVLSVLRLELRTQYNKLPL